MSILYWPYHNRLASAVRRNHSGGGGEETFGRDIRDNILTKTQSKTKHYESYQAWQGEEECMKAMLTLDGIHGKRIGLWMSLFGMDVTQKTIKVSLHGDCAWRTTRLWRIWG